MKEFFKEVFLWAHQNPEMAVPLLAFISWFVQQTVMGLFNFFILSYTPEQLATMSPRKAAIIKFIKGATGDGAKMLEAIQDFTTQAQRIIIEQKEDGSKRVIKELDPDRKIL